MKGLRAAVVRVNLPEQQLFTELQSATTAAVQVELQNDGERLHWQVKSIVNVLQAMYLILVEHVSVQIRCGSQLQYF